MSIYVPVPGASLTVPFTTVTTVTSTLNNSKTEGQALYKLSVTGAGWFVQGLPSSTFTADPTTDLATVAGANVVTGMGPVQVSTSSALPAGLAVATNYWLIRGPDANTFKFATSWANAVAGTAIDLTTAGTGTQTVDTVATVGNGAVLVQTGQMIDIDGRNGQKISIIQDSTGGKANMFPVVRGG